MKLAEQRPGVSKVVGVKTFGKPIVDGGEDVTWRMHLSLASISRVDRRPGGGPPVLACFNETAHLR